ncbi:hypothetical protein ColLi_11956 [Colletotrichum liriopes]|uniref:Uncharacterized protein n=1 Tax=Colletotrichum liriopes TaxID=708192 RepID=A0AA37GXG5_9PEZI|nr:hypothetical protein ColLi_11956 [Colletotrichum liriopes]
MASRIIPWRSHEPVRNIVVGDLPEHPEMRLGPFVEDRCVLRRANAHMAKLMLDAEASELISDGCG